VAGLRRVEFHGLRHAAGSILARVADPVFVRDYRGRSKLSTTDRYVSAKHRPEDVDRLNRAFAAEPADTPAVVDDEADSVGTESQGPSNAAGTMATPSGGLLLGTHALSGCTRVAGLSPRACPTCNDRVDDGGAERVAGLEPDAVRRVGRRDLKITI
jgi:hypothetical protein